MSFNSLLFRSLLFHSQLWLKTVVLTSLVLLQGGCGLRLFEAPPSVEPVKLEALDQGFDLHSKLKDYVRGQLSEEELDKVFDYLDEVLLAFVSRVKGESQGQFLAQELRGFFHRFILRDRVLPRELVAELMELKVFLVGGDSRTVSHEEFKDLRFLLREFQVEAQRMRPFMAFFMGLEGGENAFLARQAFATSGIQIGKILSRRNQAFYFDNLENLIVELRNFVHWDDVFEKSRQPKDWVMFVRLFAELMAGGDRHSVQPEQWPQLLAAAVQTYGLWIRYQYDLIGPNMFYGPGLSALISLVDDALILAHGAVKNQPDLVVEYERLAEVFVALEKLNLLPAQVTAQSLDQVARAMVSKIFGDMDLSPSERMQVSVGISGYELHRIGAEFSRWSVVQTYLSRQFSEQEEGGGVHPSGTSPLDQLSGRLSSEETVDVAINEFRDLVSGMRPLFSSKLGRTFLVEEVHFEKYSVAHGFFNLSAVNLLQSLLRLMFRGYTEDFERARSLAGLTEDEMQNFYTDFRPLGIDLRVMDPRSTDSGRRSFFEANMFTYSGQGVSGPSENQSNETESLLEMTVAVEFLSLLFSGGLMAHSLYEDLLEACRPLPARHVPKDDFGEEMISRDCVSRHLLRVLIPHIKNMPGLQRYLQEELTRDEGQDFAEILISAGVYHLSPQHLIERSEINTMSMILHYSEVIFTRYNLDGDDHLSHSEILEAFPKFSGFIKKLAKDMCVIVSEDRARTIYLYILSFAEIPKMDATTLRRIATMRWWPWWSLKMDRMQVVKVFGEMIRRSGTSDGVCETP